MADLARIKRNVAKMAGMNAPEADIDAYIQSEGVTVDQVRAFTVSPPMAQQPPADQFADLPYPGNPNFDPSANAPKPNLAFGTSSSSTLNPLPAISAMGNNVAANIPIAGPYLKKAGESVDAWATGQTPEQRAAVNSDMARANPVAAEAGKVVGAVAPYAIASSVPVLNQALGFSGPMMQRLFMTAGSQFGINTGDNMAKGQPFGEAAANAVLPSLMAAPAAIIGPSGKATSEPRAEALALLKKEGVPLTGGQASMNKRAMFFESQMGGEAAVRFQEKQLGQFSKAALKYAGIDADIASPKVLQKAYQDAGDKFSRLASITKPRITAPIYNDMVKVVDDYAQLKGQPAPLLATQVQRIGDMAANNGGTLSGEQYRVLITDLRKFSESATDLELKAGLGELREILDDAVEKSVGGKTLEAWQKLRAQYRNLIVITDAVSTRGPMAMQGIIDPVSLNNAVANNVGRRNYAKGYGDLNELSRAGRLLMPSLPDSGTASRSAAQTIGGLSGPAGIASYMLSSGDLNTALAVGGATAASSLLPGIAGRAMLTKPGRALVAGEGTVIPATASRGLIPMLMGQ